MVKFNISLICFAFIISGCTSETESNLLKTKAIQANYLISSNGVRTKVNAELNAGDSFSSNIRLSEDDKLFVQAAGKRLELEVDTDILDIDYEGRFDNTADNTLFKIELIRKTEQNATSEVELPLNFIILSPKKNEPIKYQQTLIFQLDGIDPASKTELVLNYGCDDSNGGIFSGSASRTISDEATFEFSLDDMKIIDSQNFSDYKNCKLDVIVYRYRIGNTSKELALTSQIRAEQVREIKNIEFSF
jgi:hypothetical protein